MIKISVAVKSRSVSIPVKAFLGIPPGGAAQQVLTKKTSDHFDYEWTDSDGGIGNYDPGDLNLIFENQLIDLVNYDPGNLNLVFENQLIDLGWDLPDAIDSTNYDPGNLNLVFENQLIDLGWDLPDAIDSTNYDPGNLNSGFENQLIQ